MDFWDAFSQLMELIIITKLDAVYKHLLGTANATIPALPHVAFIDSVGWHFFFFFLYSLFMI